MIRFALFMAPWMVITRANINSRNGVVSKRYSRIHSCARMDGSADSDCAIKLPSLDGQWRKKTGAERSSWTHRKNKRFHITSLRSSRRSDRTGSRKSGPYDSDRESMHATGEGKRGKTEHCAPRWECSSFGQTWRRFTRVAYKIT